MQYIPYGRQDIQQQDIEHVLETLQSDWITQGPMIEKFEQKLCDYTGASFSAVMNSATSCLHVACMALGVGEGDVVWTSPITFVASANCALYCGASVDFVDIDEETYNLCPQKLEEKLLVAEAENKLPKVVIPVHLSGQSCDMKKISTLAKKYGFKVIEDASHGIGGKYEDSPIGDCRYSDITVFSFHPVKIITTGEGGACLTNDENLFQKISQLRSHGITRDYDLMEGVSDGPWYYQQLCLGFNYRMTDLQASLGYSQMDRLDKYIEKRHEIAQQYRSLLADESLILPLQAQGTYNSYHLFIVRLPAEKRTEIFNKLRQANIGVNVHYIPVHLQPYYSKRGFRRGDFPIAEDYYRSCISLPMFPTLKSDEVVYICERLKEFLI